MTDWRAVLAAFGSGDGAGPGGSGSGGSGPGGSGLDGSGSGGSGSGGSGSDGDAAGGGDTGGGDAGSAESGARDPRQEAERLVGTALGALSLAVQATAGFGPGGECCACPICRLIVKMRDPSPEFAERLATGAGDLAVGVAALLRAFGTLATESGPEGADGDQGPAGADGDRDPEAAEGDQGRCGESDHADNRSA